MTFVTRSELLDCVSCNVQQSECQVTDILSQGTNELFEEAARREEMGGEIRAYGRFRNRGQEGST